MVRRSGMLGFFFSLNCVKKKSPSGISFFPFLAQREFQKLYKKDKFWLLGKKVHLSFPLRLTGGRMTGFSLYDRANRNLLLATKSARDDRDRIGNTGPWSPASVRSGRRITPLGFVGRGRAS